MLYSLGIKCKSAPLWFRVHFPFHRRLHFSSWSWNTKDKTLKRFQGTGMEESRQSRTQQTSTESSGAEQAKQSYVVGEGPCPRAASPQGHLSAILFHSHAASWLHWHHGPHDHRSTGSIKINVKFFSIQVHKFLNSFHRHQVKNIFSNISDSIKRTILFLINRWKFNKNVTLNNKGIIAMSTNFFKTKCILLSSSLQKTTIFTPLIINISVCP